MEKRSSLSKFLEHSKISQSHSTLTQPTLLNKLLRITKTTFKITTSLQLKKPSLVRMSNLLELMWKVELIYSLVQIGKIIYRSWILRITGSLILILLLRISRPLQLLIHTTPLISTAQRLEHAHFKHGISNSTARLFPLSIERIY